MQNKKILYLLIFIPWLCLSQKTYREEIINFKDGLPSDYVSCTVKKDHKLFVATQRGLCLYDGYQFVKTKYITTQTTHLFAKNKGLYFYFHGKGVGTIQTIFDDPNRIANVDYSDHNTNNDHYDNIYVDNENRIWCSDQNNIKYFIKNSKTSKSYPIDLLNKDVRFAASFVEPKQSNSLWIATHKGLFVWDKKTQKLSKHANSLLRNEKFVSSSIVNDDLILFTTEDNRILSYTISKNKVASIDIFKNSSELFYLEKKEQTANELFVYSNHEIYLLNIKSGITYKIYETKYNINSIFFDEETKIVWISSNKGLIKLVENDGAIKTIVPPEEFPHSITSIIQDNEETIWISYNTNAIYSYTKKNSWKKYELADKKCQIKNLYLHNKTIVIATNKGVFTIENEKIKNLITTPFEVKKAIIDQDDLLWVIQNKGKIRVYNKGIEQLDFIKNNAAFWQNNTFNDIAEDVNKKIWFACWMPKDFGIATFDRKTNQILEISKLKKYQNNRYFISDYYNRIGFTKENYILFSGHGGFNTCNKNGAIIHALNTLDYNVANDQIEGITGDADGNIWFASAEGLHVYSFKTNKVIQISQIDGLKTNDLTNGFCQLKNDQIALGTDAQIQIIDQKKIIQTKLFNNLELIAIEKDGEFMPNTSNHLELDYNFIELDLHFSSLSFLDKEKTIYRYKFEGDSKWTDLGANPKLPLVKLQHGNYKLIVEVGDNLNNWVKKPLLITINIKPPFYKTVWFYIFIGLLLTAIGFMINRNLVLHEKREGELKRKIKDVEMQTLRSQMNPHFLFNSLNSINSFIIQQKTNEASGYLTTFSKLMRNILDNSRHSTINLSKEIETLELYLQLESVRLDHKFEYEIICDEDMDNFGINIPPLILQPFVENSIWHGLHNKKEKGKLSIIFEDKSDYLFIKIIDDGIGRNASALLKQKDVKHKSYGIDITINRLLMLNSKNKFEIIDLYDENENAKGTEVQLELYYYD